MTTDRTLRYRPMPAPPAAEELPRALKEYLGNQLWETDQEALTGSPIVIRADNLRVVGFLEALKAVEIDGADELLEAIQEYGAVTIWVGEDDPFEL